jgi:hypothetical protein
MALTNAEKLARFRARHRAAGRKIVTLWLTPREARLLRAALNMRATRSASGERQPA